MIDHRQFAGVPLDYGQHWLSRNAREQLVHSLGVKTIDWSPVGANVTCERRREGSVGLHISFVWSCNGAGTNSSGPLASPYVVSGRWRPHP